MEIDLFEKIYELVRQIPRGKVSSYGAVARALGDIRASRAVGVAMNLNPDPDLTPCYRVVNSDGTIGGFSLGIEEKIRRLRNDDIEVDGNKIRNFGKVYFEDFESDFPLKKLRREQIRLRRKVMLEDVFDKIEKVGGLDVAYSMKNRKLACAAFVAMDVKGRTLERKWIVDEISFPYIPTYLAYREIPLYIKLIDTMDEKPDVIMVDGNGILHPLGIGIASHLGVLTGIPTIGVAKGLLCGERKGDAILVNGKIHGYAIYRYKKPVFASPGHKISVETTLKLVKDFLYHRIPEPIRQAHILAKSKIREVDSRT